MVNHGVRRIPGSISFTKTTTELRTRNDETKDLQAPSVDPHQVQGTLRNSCSNTLDEGTEESQMKRDDWRCPGCDSLMIKTSDTYMACPDCDARLRRVPHLNGLLRSEAIAIRHDYKRFHIIGESGFWEYVPHAHKLCLEHAPKEGEIVARTPLTANYRTFRRSSQPRKLA